MTNDNSNERPGYRFSETEGETTPAKKNFSVRISVNNGQYKQSIKDQEEEAARILEHRNSMARSIRSAYFNLHSRSSRAESLGNISTKVAFIDFDENQKRILQKCRKTYQTYHPEDGKNKDDLSDDEDENLKDDWDDEFDEDSDEEEELFDLKAMIANFSIDNVKKIILGTDPDEDAAPVEKEDFMYEKCCKPHIFEGDKDAGFKAKEEDIKEENIKELSENQHLGAITRKRSEEDFTKKALASMFENATQKERKQMSEEIVYFHPYSLMIFSWLFQMSYMAYMALMTINKELAFNDCKTWIHKRHEAMSKDYMTWSICHLADIVITFNCGYVDHARKMVIMNKTLVWHNYCWSFTFFLDIISAVSWDMVMTYVSFHLHDKGVIDLFDRDSYVNTYNMSTWITCLHCVKFLRMFKVMEYAKRLAHVYGLQNEQAAGNYFTMRLFWTIYYLLDLSTCVQWFIPKVYNYPSDSWPVRNKFEIAGRGPDGTMGTATYPGVKLPEVLGGYFINPRQYVTNDIVYELIETQGPQEFGIIWAPTNGTHIAKSTAGGDRGHEANQMRSYNQLMGKVRWTANLTDYRGLDWEIKYQFGFLKTCAQMLTLAYGGTPHAETEILFHCICIVVGATIWGLLLAVIINYISQISSKESVFCGKLNEINAYTNFKNLPSISRQLLLKYFEICWEGKIFDENEIMVEVSPTLRKRILIHSRLPWIVHAPVFKNISVQFLLEVACTMHDELYMTNQLIVSNGRLCDKIIIPYEGDLLQYIPSLDIMEILQPGVILGEMSLVLKKNWNGEVYSLGWTRAWTVNPQDIRELGKLFPRDYKRLLRNVLIYSEIIDDVDYIEEIDEKLTQIKKSGKCKDTNKQRRRKIGKGEDHFTMSKKLQSGVNKFIEKHTLGLESELKEEAEHRRELMEREELYTDSSTYNSSDYTTDSQYESSDESADYRGNSKFNHAPAPSKGILKDSVAVFSPNQVAALKDNLSLNSISSSNESKSRKFSQIFPLKLNPFASNFSARLETFKNPVFLAQSQMLTTMLVKRESVVVEKMFEDEAAKNEDFEEGPGITVDAAPVTTRSLTTNSSNESQLRHDLEESWFGNNNQQTNSTTRKSNSNSSLSRRVSVKDILGFRNSNTRRVTSSSSLIKRNDSNSQMTGSNTSMISNQKSRSSILTTGHLDAMKRQMSVNSRSHMLLANQFARENKQKESGVIQLYGEDDDSVNSNNYAYDNNKTDDQSYNKNDQPSKRTSLAAIATEKILDTDMTSNLVSTHVLNIKSSYYKVLRRKIRLISNESKIKMRGKDRDDESVDDGFGVNYINNNNQTDKKPSGS